MAVNIAKAGFNLIVHDIREEPLRELRKFGAQVARSSKEVAKHSELIEIAKLDSARVETVFFGDTGILMGAKPGTLVAIHSTVLPKTLK